MAKFKLDTQKLKQLAVERGELIALGVAGLLLVFFFAHAVLALMSARSPAPRIKTAADALKNKIAGATPAPEEKQPGKDTSITTFEKVKPSLFATGPYFD